MTASPGRMTSLPPGTAAPPLPRRRFLAYGLTDGEPSAAVVVHGSALPLVFEDDTWTRFGFGERFGTRDAHAQAPARRNVFAHARAGDPVPAGAWAEVLQRRGVLLVPCDTTLARPRRVAPRRSRIRRRPCEQSSSRGCSRAPRWCPRRSWRSAGRRSAVARTCIPADGGIRRRFAEASLFIRSR